MRLAVGCYHEDAMAAVEVGELLTDETFALAITKLNYTDGKLSYDWLNASNLMAYLTWAGSSCLGALLGGLAELQISGSERCI